jgi:hypothetical protein
MHYAVLRNLFILHAGLNDIQDTPSKTTKMVDGWQLENLVLLMFLL